MVVVETAILIASLYLGDKILEHIIQEEIWTKRILHKIFPPLTGDSAQTVPVIPQQSVPHFPH